jgi:hypothetical protein
MKSSMKSSSSRLSKICCRTSGGSRSHGEALAELVASDFTRRLALGVFGLTSRVFYLEMVQLRNFASEKGKEAPFVVHRLYLVDVLESC